jgi:hypothetical protein
MSGFPFREAPEDMRWPDPTPDAEPSHVHVPRPSRRVDDAPTAWEALQPVALDDDAEAAAA